MTLMERRRALMAVKKGGGRLPAEYQEVEWIGYDGAGRVLNTNIPGSTVEKIKVRMARLNTINQNTVFPCAFSGNNFSGTPYNFIETSNIFSIFPAVAREDTFGMTDFTLTKTGRFDESIGIGYRDGWCPKMRYGQLEMYNSSNDLLSALVPCYRKSDNAIGMYDIVNSRFNPAINLDGMWTKGNDV